MVENHNYDRVISTVEGTMRQLALFWVIILLNIDSVNPVKIILHVFPQLASWHVTAVSLLVIVYIFISNVKSLLYFSVKVFFNSILSIFFREVQVIGRGNIPSYGPVIYTGNHANQFIDGVVIFCTCQRTISYLIADKSWHRILVGNLAWAMGAVPIKRAQDSAKKGTGTVRLKIIPSQASNAEGRSKASIFVTGEGTKFTLELKPGDKIRFPDSAVGYKVKTITDDTSLKIEATDTDPMPDPSEDLLSFDVLPRVDQKTVYGQVLHKLVGEGTIGIFPEGGSHDRTDLLPLKAGVALIAYSALERDGLNVPIVPVGLNYFRTHRFRGRAIVEYGPPTYIDPDTLADFKKGGEDKRRVCNELLGRIEDSMRSVLVTTPDYETLQIIYTARRLYQQNLQQSAPSEKQDLNRRFAEGYKKLLLLANGSPPKQWVSIQQRLISYQKELDDLGIKDYQVIAFGSERAEFDGDIVLREMRLPYRIASTVILILLALLPATFLNLPVGFIARIYAERRRKYALANSQVKVLARDVILSEKVLLCIVLVPALWVLYGLLLFFFTDMDGPTLALVYFSMPIFSYMGIMATEAGVVNFKDLRPHLMRLLPSSRVRLSALPGMRKSLQRDLRMMIKEFGPVLGDIYYEKNVDWKIIQEKTRKNKSQGDLLSDIKKTD